jgi:hypothetical protein
MRKLLLAGAAIALVSTPIFAQTTSPTAPTSADRTTGAVGSERGNNSSSLNGSNAASGTYSGANAPSNTDAGRTSGGSGGAGGGN